MNSRRDLILKVIVESFIQSAQPIGSEALLEESDLEVSSATVRNDMMYLEEQGLIYQPHTSAGRIPTDRGLRKFVDEMMEEVHFTIPAKFINRLAEIDKLHKRLVQIRAEEKIHAAVSVLARLCDNVSFATIPWHGQTYYLGLANTLRQPEFQDPLRASTVVEILEDTDNFHKFLNRLSIGEDVSVFIGRENILEAISSCSIIATTYHIHPKFSGILGILGPVRMKYSYNIAAIGAVKSDLH